VGLHRQPLVAQETFVGAGRTEPSVIGAKGTPRKWLPLRRCSGAVAGSNTSVRRSSPGPPVCRRWCLSALAQRPAAQTRQFARG
jgi:hypothetical protein